MRLKNCQGISIYFFFPAEFICKKKLLAMEFQMNVTYVRICMYVRKYVYIQTF